MEASGLSCGGDVRENFERIRKAVNSTDFSTIYQLIHFYTSEMKEWKSILSRLSVQQKRLYQIQKIHSNTINL